MAATHDRKRAGWTMIAALAALGAGACPGDDAGEQNEGSAGGPSSSLGEWRTVLQPTPPPPTLPECLAGPCERNRDCDDGLFCTGVEECDPRHELADACGCVRPRRSPCGGSSVCDEVWLTCWPAPRTGACSRRCASHSDCDDGLFCNGPERCAPGDPMVDSCGCVHALRPACDLGQSCRESEDTCVTTCDSPLDEDRDGEDSFVCGGNDCDDTDERRYPAAPEVCDARNLDEDCNPETFGDRDVDRDGYADAVCCNNDGTADLCGDDCDDQRADVHPSEAESCDGFDNDCDGAVDEYVGMSLYTDADGDGYGTGTSEHGCPGTPHTSTINGDCDDANPALEPGALRCDGKGPNVIFECMPDGTWFEHSCGTDAQAVPIPCVNQPNGTGHCFR